MHLAIGSPEMWSHHLRHVVVLHLPLVTVGAGGRFIGLGHVALPKILHVACGDHPAAVVHRGDFGFLALEHHQNDRDAISMRDDYVIALGLHTMVDVALYSGHEAHLGLLEGLRVLRYHTEELIALAVGRVQHLQTQIVGEGLELGSRTPRPWELLIALIIDLSKLLVYHNRQLQGLRNFVRSLEAPSVRRDSDSCEPGFCMHLLQVSRHLLRYPHAVCGDGRVEGALLALFGVPIVCLVVEPLAVPDYRYRLDELAVNLRR
mmetsp:Transcript_122707/g.261864  ORF Transcript_122707/g.261864 Transcript_122707/m.261864 type:complete len:262 (+) Transcript_122707:226-1011(+)